MSDTHRKRAICLLAVITSVCLLIPGCGSSRRKGQSGYSRQELAHIPLTQSQQLPDASGGFVISVAGRSIDADEVISPAAVRLAPLARNNTFENFKTEAEPTIRQIALTKISNILLYQKAEKQAGEDIHEALEKAVKAEVQKFINQFGGDIAQAEAVLQEMDMSWETFRYHIRSRILSQSYLQTQLPEEKTVSHSELIELYEQVKDRLFTQPAKIQFRLIDIVISQMDVNDPNIERREKAEQLAAHIMEQFEAGADFGTLAKKYSHGYRSSQGGLWQEVQPSSLAEPYHIIAEAAEKIAPGEVSEPIGAGGHIFIIKLIKKQPTRVAGFEQVQDKLEARLRLKNKQQAIEKLSNQFLRQARLVELQEFIQFCLWKLYVINNQ